MAKNGNKVAKIKDTNGLPAKLNDMFDLKDNIEGVTPRLPQISILHQAQQFQLPDDTKTDSFEGYIIDTNPANAYWETSFSSSGGGTPPNCFSLDGLRPHESLENPKADSCVKCKNNRFGSDGRGKACKNLRRVHIHVDGKLLPERLTLPPSSIRAFEDYLIKLTDKGFPYMLVRTKFSLREKSNKDGIKYSEIVCNDVDIIKNLNTAKDLKKMRDDYHGAMRGQLIEEVEAQPQEDDIPI